MYSRYLDLLLLVSARVSFELESERFLPGFSHNMFTLTPNPLTMIEPPFYFDETLLFQIR